MASFAHSCIDSSKLNTMSTLFHLLLMETCLVVPRTQQILILFIKQYLMKTKKLSLFSKSVA